MFCRKVRLTTIFDASFINTLSPQTPNLTAANSAPQSSNNTPKRHQSFVSHKEAKKVVKSTMSLDRHSLKPLNLKGISNGNSDGAYQPLLAVVDEKNNIQVNINLFIFDAYVINIESCSLVKY